MFEVGFLGTRAPLYMDITTLIVALLPFLIGLAISFAKRGNYNLHKATQIAIYIISVLVVGYFEVGVRVGGGYRDLSEGSSVAHNYLIIVLIVHIIIATVTLFLWTYTVISGYLGYKKALLPGAKSKSHKLFGKITYIGIVLTAFTGIWVYLLLFVY